MTMIITKTKAISVTPSQKLLILKRGRENCTVHEQQAWHKYVRNLSRTATAPFLQQLITSAGSCTVTRAIQSMRDAHDHITFDLLFDEAAPLSPCTTKPKLGRPSKPDALSDAERARRYRVRKKTRLAELRDETVPVSSTVIDLTALPPWKRRAA